MQFPRRKVDTAGQKAGSLPTVTQSHPDNSRPAATGIDGQEGVDMDKDCKVQWHIANDDFCITGILVMSPFFHYRPFSTLSMPVPYTFHVRHSRGKLYVDHGRLCVSSLSLVTFPHYCMHQDVTWGNGRRCHLVLHYWAIGRICSWCMGFIVCLFVYWISSKRPVAATNMLHSTELVTVYKCSTETCYDNIHICKLITLHTANVYSTEWEMSASACTQSMAGTQCWSDGELA